MLTRDYEETGGRNFQTTFDRPDRYLLASASMSQESEADHKTREARADFYMRRGDYDEYRWLPAVGPSGMWEMALEDANVQLTLEATRQQDVHLAATELAKTIVPTVFVVSETPVHDRLSA